MADENKEAKKKKIHSFACTGCGADLKYKPGTKHLHCEYCGAENEIQELDEEVKELDFHEFFIKQGLSEKTLTQTFVKCKNCGASSTLDPKISSDVCPYCATPLIIEEAETEEIIQPKSLLPFALNKESAKKSLKKWAYKRWFAPKDFKKYIYQLENLKAVFIPYWTYDTYTYSEYTGERGEYYYETETYTTTVDGKEVTKTREVLKTRWYSASGSVRRAFDDIMVSATKSLPDKYVHKLEPWDLENLIPFDKSYLSGLITEKYQVDLVDGFKMAKAATEPEIRSLVESDIGGDEQHIYSIDTTYNNITFKHLLLPVFLGAYKRRRKIYRILVNARTGEVQGERPYSWIKILLAVIATAIIVIILIVNS